MEFGRIKNGQSHSRGINKVDCKGAVMIAYQIKMNIIEEIRK